MKLILESERNTNALLTCASLGLETLGATSLCFHTFCKMLVPQSRLSW